MGVLPVESTDMAGIFKAYFCSVPDRLFKGILFKDDLFEKAFMAYILLLSIFFFSSNIYTSICF